jgi:DNA-binding HxlR family transcriptional regulator
MERIFRRGEYTKYNIPTNLTVTRTVCVESPVIIEYTATPYARTLKKVINELHIWGVNHKIIIGK